MKIAWRLYLGFGAILALLLILFSMNIFTVRREYNARDAVAATLTDVQTIESVRFQMMENRLYLGNYLLSGDLRDEDKTNKGVAQLFEQLKESESKASDQTLRNALSQVEEAEHNWNENFAKPMIAKRHQVDSGDTTVSDLQIYYLQHDPGSWVSRSSDILDNANSAVRKSLDDTNSSARAATSFSTILSTVGTLLAILVGVLFAFYTARSITGPLYHLIDVAKRISECCHLQQTIDIHRHHGVGVLADKLNKMILHLREMASVS